jgi:hypothetical protein
MPRNRCPNGTRKNKSGECVKHRVRTLSAFDSSEDAALPIPTNAKKNKCVRSKRTNRCKASVKNNATSSTCTYFRRTQRCRSVKVDEKFVEYKNYKVKGNVKHFLQKNVAGVALKDLIERAKMNPSYEDTLQFIFENPKKTESQIKNEFETEILELAHNHVRDNGDQIVTLKSVKYVLSNNSGFGFLLD